MTGFMTKALSRSSDLNMLNLTGAVVAARGIRAFAPWRIATWITWAREGTKTIFANGLIKAATAAGVITMTSMGARSICATILAASGMMERPGQRPGSATLGTPKATVTAVARSAPGTIPGTAEMRTPATIGARV